MIYGNCKVLAPNGKIMFRCNFKKINWYLNKGLANKIDDKTIILSFIPNGGGYCSDKFYLQERDNICVVCGNVNELSKHHVVPYCYRKYFPDCLKKHNYHDVLPLCDKCHRLYEEKHSIHLKEELSNQYDVPLNGEKRIVDRDRSRAIKYAYALIHYAEKIPVEKKTKLLKTVADYLKVKCPSLEQLEELVYKSCAWRKSVNYKTHGQVVISKVENLQQFVIVWRNHFVETMNPQYLPDDWMINRKINDHLSRDSCESSVDAT